MICMCNFAWKGRPQNDPYCVGQDVQPYSLIHSNRSSQLLLVQVVLAPSLYSGPDVASVRTSYLYP